MDKNGPFRRQPRVVAEPDAELYPALLDGSQWTQAATFDTTDRPVGPSARIGRYYRQQLDEMNQAQLAEQRVERTAPASPLKPVVERHGWAAGLPCRPLLAPLAAEEEVAPIAPLAERDALAILARQREAAEQQEESMYHGTFRTRGVGQAHVTDPVELYSRMAHYVAEGIDVSCLAPFNTEWTENAMEQVPQELAGVPEDVVAGQINDMVGEVQADYYDAVKASMVDYVLKSSSECHRLEITKPPAKFERTTFHPSQDEAVAECALPLTLDSLSLGQWHEDVLGCYEGMERSLAVNHEGMLQMLELWGHYQHFQLCSLANLPPVEAVELERFKDMQHSHCEKVVQTLKKKWFQAVLEIFRAHGEGGELSPSLLSTVSTLMFNQLRALLTSSIDAYVAFFENYSRVGAAA